MKTFKREVTLGFEKNSALGMANAYFFVAELLKNLALEKSLKYFDEELLKEVVISGIKSFSIKVDNQHQEKIIISIEGSGDLQYDS